MYNICLHNLEPTNIQRYHRCFYEQAEYPQNALYHRSSRKHFAAMARSSKHFLKNTKNVSLEARRGASKLPVYIPIYSNEPSTPFTRKNVSRRHNSPSAGITLPCARRNKRPNNFSDKRGTRNNRGENSAIYTTYMGTVRPGHWQAAPENALLDRKIWRE